MSNQIMKDSNVEWIGQIPSGWDNVKISSIYRESSIKVSDVDYLPLSVTKKGVLPQLENVAKTKNGDNRKLVEVGDFVINSRSDRKGSSGLSAFTGSVSVINTVLKPTTNTSSLYYHFLFKSNLFTEEFYKWGTGIVEDLWSTKWSKMKKINIPLPPLHEQQAIATYLDKQVSRLDQLIEDQQQVIDDWKSYKQSLITETVTKGLDPEVEMKDSGIEWIGEIPSHWKVNRVKRMCYMKGRIGWQGLKASEFIDEGPFLVTGTDFENGKVLWSRCYRISKERFLEAPDIHLRQGDLLITKDGTIGKLAYIEELPGLASLNSHLLLIRPTTGECINKFMYWIFSSSIFKKYTGLKQGGSIMESLSQKKIGEFSLPIPPLHEQQQIADFLDEKCLKIDQLIEDKQRLIEDLKAYKQSLIYECVTGKKEIV